MLLMVKKEDIIEGLQRATSIIPPKASASYLRAVWLKADEDTLSIITTDANIEFTGAYEADVQEKGLVGVNGKNFVDLIRRLPDGDIKLRLEESEEDDSKILVLSQGRRTYKLPTNESAWFQELATFPTENPIMWSGDFFKDVIDHVFFCISDDDMIDALGCLYLRPLEPEPNSDKRTVIDVCGLNGHQFALTRFIHDEIASRLPEQGLLIPRKYVGELRKWLNDDEVEINFTEKRFFIRSADRNETLSLPRSKELYPDYTSFLSRISADNVSHLTVNRKELLNALDRISVFNTDADRCAYFELTPEELVFSAEGQDTGSAKEVIDIHYDGDIKKIAFPTKNMMEICNHYQSHELNLILTTPEGPCGVTGNDDPDYTVLIMPMKMTDHYYSEETTSENEDDVDNSDNSNSDN